MLHTLSSPIWLKCICLKQVGFRPETLLNWVDKGTTQMQSHLPEFSLRVNSSSQIKSLTHLILCLMINCSIVFPAVSENRLAMQVKLKSDFLLKYSEKLVFITSFNELTFSIIAFVIFLIRRIFLFSNNSIPELSNLILNFRICSEAGTSWVTSKFFIESSIGYIQAKPVPHKLFNCHNQKCFRIYYVISGKSNQGRNSFHLRKIIILF